MMSKRRQHVGNTIIPTSIVSARQLVDTIKPMLSVDSLPYWDKVREVFQRWQVKFVHTGEPFSLVVPTSGFRVDIKARPYRPILIDIRDGSLFGPDCYIYDSHIALGRPVEIPKGDGCPDHLWGNYNDGILTEIIAFYPEGNVTYCTDNNWTLLYNTTGTSMPLDAKSFIEQYDAKIPLMMECSQLIAEFFTNSGLPDLHQELAEAWPCQKCGEPKSAHQGIKLEHYDPMASL